MEADIIVSCPYNPTHRIRKFKLMSHISKCKKTSNAVNKIECPLDKSHIVDRDHLREHIASCPSLGKSAWIEMDNEYVQLNVNTETTSMVAHNSIENWEEEPEVPPYDPMEVSAKKPVLRCVSGLTKSEKRKFRENERIRMANLKGFNIESEASSSMKDTFQEVPLRPPRDITSKISSSMKDTFQEVPLRPPCDTTSKISQDNFNKSTQKHNHDASIQTTFVPEFHNNSFHSMLYDELAPEDDSIKQLEQTLRSTDARITLGDYLQHFNGEKENFPISDQNQETKIKERKTEIVTSKLFNDNDNKKKGDKCIASSSSAPSERVTDKLLTLLKDESDKKEQPMEKTIKIDQINKDSDESEQTWDEVLNKLNERLVYLANIQNAAAEESAQLLSQLKKLKPREESASKK